MVSAAEHCSPSRNFWHRVGDAYDEHLIARAHPTVLQWPMVGEASTCLYIVFCYSLFVNWLGPKFMRNRKPFDLRWLMVPYNVSLVIANFYIFYEYAKIKLSGSADIQCSPIHLTQNLEENPKLFKLAEITWYFYLSKYFELLDTVFFVLRKKERQLSRLHLIHHTIVPMLCLGLLRSEPGGYNSFFPLANSFVHCIMYTYYGISALGDDVVIHLKFKKYVTMIQLVQFISVLLFFITRPFYGCSWNWLQGGGNIAIAGFFFMLFINFYYHEYLKNKQENELNKINGLKKSKDM